MFIQVKSFLITRMFQNSNLCSRAKSGAQREGEEGEESPAARPGGRSGPGAAHHRPALPAEAEKSPRRVEKR